MDDRFDPRRSATCDCPGPDLWVIESWRPTSRLSGPRLRRRRGERHKDRRARRRRHQGHRPHQDHSDRRFRADPGRHPMSGVSSTNLAFTAKGDKNAKGSGSLPFVLRPHRGDGSRRGAASRLRDCGRNLAKIDAAGMKILPRQPRLASHEEAADRAAAGMLKSAAVQVLATDKGRQR